MKKKLLGIVLTLCLIIALVPTVALAADPWNGTAMEVSETAEDGSDGSGYYLIDAAEELAWVAGVVNGDITDGTIPSDKSFSGKTIVLTSDIDLNNQEWVPIGYDYQAKFKGTFDGNGHIVSGLYITSTYNYYGLFGYNEGKIQNLVVNSDFSVPANCVAGIAGNNRGMVTNCYNSGSITGNYGVGGVVASNQGTVTNCYNTGSINGENIVGGVVGQNSSTVTNCSNSGSFSGTSGWIGGLVGYNHGQISDCYNSGDENGNSGGGVVGGNQGIVINCYNSGSVNGEYVGGVASVNFSGGKITNCYNIGSINSNNIAGGLVGSNQGGTITNCYNTGSFSGTLINSGGLVGNNISEGTVQYCYWLNDVMATPIGSDGATVKQIFPFTVNQGQGLASGIPIDSGSTYADTDSLLVALNNWVDDASANVLGGVSWYENGYPGLKLNITTLTNAGGSISPEAVMVTPGENQSFTITADTGYQLTDVEVDYISVGEVDSYDFNNITIGHTIKASFEQLTYDITASAGTGGSISPDGAVSVNHGESQTFTITADQGYQITDVLIDGTSIGAVSSFQFDNVTDNHTISASFEQLTYDITASAGTGGSISPSGDTNVNHGESQTFTITPDTGYRIKDVLIDDVKVEVTDNSYTFGNVTKAYTITVNFEPIPSTGHKDHGSSPDEEPTPEEPETPDSGDEVNEPFVDMDEDDWYYEPAQYVRKKKLMQGTSKDEFSPTLPTTRGMIVTVLWRLEDEEAAANSSFTDLVQDWYKQAVNWAAEKDIVEGYNKHEYGAEDDISREQLATILYRYAKSKGYDMSKEDDLSGYSDADNISDYAEPAMRWAVAEGIIEGEDGEVAPQDKAVRAQVAAVLMRFLENIGE